jgi:hypothetical protein
MEGQEQILECLQCPFCQLENPPEAAVWILNKDYVAICQGCRETFRGTFGPTAKMESSPN